MHLHCMYSFWSFVQFMFKDTNGVYSLYLLIYLFWLWLKFQYEIRNSCLKFCWNFNPMQVTSHHHLECLLAETASWTWLRLQIALYQIPRTIKCYSLHLLLYTKYLYPFLLHMHACNYASLSREKRQSWCNQETIPRKE